MRWIACCLVSAALLAAAPVAAAAKEHHSEPGRCPNGKSKTAATWLSVAHPGLGEWYLKGWGRIDRAPQLKFWLGFIPFYGWPGYLQVKSANDANQCKTNDHLKWGT